MKRLLIATFILCSFSVFSQTDKFENQSLKFAKMIIQSNSISEIEKLLNDSLHGDLLSNDILLTRKHLIEFSDRIEFYVVKINAPIPIYNINLHDPKALEQFGDLRIMFTNEKDLLIDKWKFFEKRNPKLDNNEEEMPSKLPPRPPAPPRN